MKRKEIFLGIMLSTLLLSTLFTILSGCSASQATKARTTPTATIPAVIPSRAPATAAVSPSASNETEVDTGSPDFTLLIAQIMDTTNTFWTYAKSREWESMWYMLHPEAQSAYAGKNDFIRMSESIFGNVSLKSFTIGKVEFKKNQNEVDYSEVQVTLFISIPGGNAQYSTSTTFFVVKHNNVWMPVLIWDDMDHDLPLIPIPSNSQETTILY